MKCSVPRRKKKCPRKKSRRTLKINVVAPQGLVGPPGPAGPKGPAGPQGLPGTPGGGLLTSYDFVEIPDPMVAGGPVITTVVLSAAPATIGPELQISNQSVALANVNVNSRVVLRATFVWSFTFITELAPQLAVASQVMRFGLFRDAPLIGERVSTVIDTGSVTQINVEGMGTTFVSGTFTTTFECTDTGVPGPSVNYYLTAAAGPASGFGVGTNGSPTTITNFTNPMINEIHFSGEVIGPNVL